MGTIRGIDGPDYTVRLPRGAVLSGRVVDDQENPIPGVRLTLDRPGSMSNRRENVDYLDDMAYITSNAQGEWTCDFLAPELGGITLYLAHPEFAPSAERVSFKETKQPLVIRMSKGLTLSGKAVDPKGNPVVDAEITGTLQYFGPQLSTRSADDGRFALLHAPSGKLKIRAQAPGFQDLEQTVTVTAGMDNLRLELQPNAALGSGLLRGRVLDEEGQPIAGIYVRLRSPQNQMHKLWSMQTDDEGRFYWDAAPDEVATYTLGAYGYQQLDQVALMADGTEHLIPMRRMKPPLLVFTVANAVTKQPVERFKVLHGSGVTGPDDGHVEFRLLGEGVNGTAELVYAVLSGPWQQLQVEAEGYDPVLIKAPPRDETVGGRKQTSAQWTEDQEFRIELEPSPGWFGRVLQPDGAPAQGAQVALAGWGLLAQMQAPGQLLDMPNYDAQRLTRTAADGSSP